MTERQTMTYQQLFNNTLRDIRMMCNATGNSSLADSIIKRLFDLSDDLRDNDIIKETKDSGQNQRK